ncbi:MAG: RagB/SusD family nutrient uptake outer membrane protein [Odoribacter sp.]|nr:RagB/SusD family nutrient uptake outer membrane protein [Odoribacter sp.]
MEIWRYGFFAITGVDGIRGTSLRDNNWIFYRYADILLMKAEGLVMSGEQYFSEATELVSQIRTRAGNTTQLYIPDTEREALMIILEERQREFIAEGKRWFDVLRVAQWNDYDGPYRSYLVEVLLAPLSARDRPNWESKLSDPNSYYLPIYKTDVDRSNGVLVQNPFYENQS